MLEWTFPLGIGSEFVVLKSSRANPRRRVAACSARRRNYVGSEPDHTLFARDTETANSSASAAFTPVRRCEAPAHSADIVADRRFDYHDRNRSRARIPQPTTSHLKGRFRHNARLLPHGFNVA